ncbi:MAG: TAXI family TRAP transporter solute-binding subunit [Clostridia bacterium]
MKRKIASLMASVLIVSALLTGCNTSEVNLTFDAGGTTGTYYPVGGVMATVLNDKMDTCDLTVVSSGASKTNIIDIEDGEAELAIVQNDVMYYAANGTDLFAEDGVFDSFSAVANIYAETCQIICTTEINSVEDLVGKTINVGDAGSGVEFNATQILAAYGIDINTDITKVNGSFSDAADSLKDGKIDAAFVTAGAPTTAVVELALTKDVKLLSIDDAHADQLIADYPFYTKTIVPADTYNGISEDIQTVSVSAALIIANSVSEDVAYDLTKAMFENLSSLQDGHAKFLELSLESAVEGVPTAFHPGALKYYQEVGVLG